MMLFLLHMWFWYQLWCRAMFEFVATRVVAETDVLDLYTLHVLLFGCDGESAQRNEGIEKRS